MRVAVFIDNSNVFKNIKRIRKTTPNSNWTQMYDPLELAKNLVGSRELVLVYFYCVPPPPWLLDENEVSQKRHTITSKYFAAVSKLPNVEIKYGYLQGDKTDPHEKNIDTQLSSDMVFGAALGHYDTAILVSNDGDFQSAIINTKKLGKRVELLFFGGYVSGALRGNCDLIRKARKSYFVPIKFE